MFYFSSLQPIFKAMGHQATSRRLRNSRRKNCLSKNGLPLPHIRDEMGARDGLLQAGLHDDDLRPTLCAHVCRKVKPNESPDDLEKNIEEHDILDAIQRTHEATVALWLAGSWQCNLGPTRSGEISQICPPSIYRPGDGADGISDESGSDTLDFDKYRLSHVSLSVSGADVTVVLADGGRILLKDQLIGGGIENFRMADGYRSWNKLVEDLANPPSPGDGNDDGGGGDDGDGGQDGGDGAPLVVSLLDTQTAPEDSPWNFSVPAKIFVGGGALTYSASLANGGALPGWMKFDPTTLSFSGLPGNADIGALALKVTATNASGAAATAMLNVTVANVNDAPVVITPVAAQSASQNQAWTYTNGRQVTETMSSTNTTRRRATSTP